MHIGWLYDKNGWFYFTNSGSMCLGWVHINNQWYFFKSNGVMASNEWCGGYWLNRNGAWTYKAKGRWRHNTTGWWFEDTLGWYPKNQSVRIDDTVYSFDARGYWMKPDDNTSNQ